ncbi:tetratricopeptide repeat protein [Myxococcota bacterium]|nr:tetratricopeptide repeat protein [Myxococcota bacterium]
MLKLLKNVAITGGLALASACASTPPPPVEKPVEVAKPKEVEVKPADRLGAANALFAKNDFAGAVSAYDAILAAEPNNDTVAFNRAVALQRAGRLDEAKKVYLALLAKDANDVEATLNLGAIYKAEDKIDDGIALYTKFLKNDEYNSRVLNNLSVFYRLKKQHAKAIDTLRKLLMRDQRNVDAYKNLALVYYDQKKFKLTQTILANAAKMAEKAGKKDPDIFVNIGMLQIALGDNGKAMAAFKEAVGVDPNHVVANYNIGALALAHRDYDLAARSYGVVASAWPDNYEVTASLGYALQGQQKLDESAKLLEKARALKAKEGVARADVPASEEEQIVYQLWQIHQTANNLKAALGFADEYLKLKNKVCKEGDADELCGRYAGIKYMADQEAKGAAQPAPEPEKKPQGGKVDIFTDAPVPPEEAAPTDGQAPADGSTPAGGTTDQKPDDAAGGGAPAEPKK